MLYSKTEQGLQAVGPHTFYMRKWRRDNPNYYANLYNKLMNKLREAFGNKCVICGQVYSLQFAHIKPTGLSGDGRGLRARYYDIKKHPECYTLMCKKDHDSFDAISQELKMEWLEKNAKFKYLFNVVNI